MAVRNVLLAAFTLSALVVCLDWMKRPSDLNFAPLYFGFMAGFAFAAFLLVVVVGCFIFLLLKQFRGARNLSLLGGCGAILVWVGLVILPTPTQLIRDPANVSLGIEMGLNTPLGFVALALIAGGILVHFARSKDRVK